jgi:predicted MFS family arabinose efflux permease
MALNGFLVVLIEMPLVHRMEHKREIFPFIIAGTLCLPLCFLFLLFGKQMLLWAIVYTVIITFSEILAMPFMMNYALSRPPKPRQGQYAALYSIAYGIANICAPVVGLGSADRWGFDNMFYLLIGIGLVTVLGFWFLSKKSAS